MNKLNDREKRTITIGIVAAAAILIFTVGTRGYDHWQTVRSSLNTARRQLNEVALSPAQRAGLAAIVPVAELPMAEEQQKFLFRDKLHEQLKKAGIKVEPLTIKPARRKVGLPFQIVQIQCKGKCNFDQLLGFLASLDENPYLVGVDELSFKFDPKQNPEQRKDLELSFTVSTFVQPSLNVSPMKTTLLQ